MRMILIGVLMLSAASAQYVPPGGSGSGGSSISGLTTGKVPKAISSTAIGNSTCFSESGSAASFGSCTATIGATVLPALPSDVLNGKGIFGTTGLTGWTSPTSNLSDWSIVGGNLHHSPGIGDSRLATSITIAESALYSGEVTVTAQTAGSAFFNLGADCNSDCSGPFAIGSNSYLATSGEAGSSVFEIACTADSDITISVAHLLYFLPAVAIEGAINSNTAIGAYTLAANTTGTSNTAFGVATLHANTTGLGNTAAGYKALANNTTGINNTAFGYQALANLTTGITNVAVGEGALLSLSTGSRNIAIVDALQNLTTGGENVGLGNVACSGITTGSNNICIGKGADPGSNTTGFTVIGNNDTTVFKARGAPQFPEGILTPASSTANCTAGQIAFDSGFAYFCVAANSWKRVAIATW